MDEKLKFVNELVQKVIDDPELGRMIFVALKNTLFPWEEQEGGKGYSCRRNLFGRICLEVYGQKKTLTKSNQDEWAREAGYRLVDDFEFNRDEDITEGTNAS